MLEYKEIIKSKQIKALIEDAMKNPKGESDLVIAKNGKTYKIEITQAKR